MRQMSKLLTIGAVLALAGCGQTVGQQAVIGAGAGAVGASATGGDPAAGAVVGAAANVAYCDRYPTKCN